MAKIRAIFCQTPLTRYFVFSLFPCKVLQTIVRPLQQFSVENPSTPHVSEAANGFLLVDKTPGPTSFGVIARLRRITGVKKIGHAGTLDPFASGLLLIAIGRSATKEIARFVGLDKVYEAEIVLGVSSTTLDPEGELTPVPLPSPNLLIKRLTEAMNRLTGDLNQIPPMHSAVKIDGVRLYKLARKGQEVERAPRPIHVSQFDLMEPPIQDPDGTLRVRARIACSSGTYVRALARDLGEALGTSAYLSALRRTQIGRFHIEDAYTIEDLTPSNWQNFFIEP